MAKKLIALLAVLALVMTPFFVIGEETQAADPETLTLDDIKNDTYWVKGTLDTSTGIMTLTNNTSSTKFIPLITTTTGTISKVVSGTDFHIPEKAAMIVASVPFEINKDVTVYGTFASDTNSSNEPLTKVTDNAILTFDGAIVGVLPTYGGEINLGMGSSVVFDNSATAVDACIHLNGTHALDLSTLMCSGVTITNASTTTSTKLDFTGDVIGYSSELSDMYFCPNVVYSLKNFSARGLTINLQDGGTPSKPINKDFFMYNDSKVIDLTNDVLIDADDPSALFCLKSGGDTNLLIADLVDGTETVRLKATLSADGLTAYFTLITMASTGIKSIDSESRITFLEAGQMVDLTKIKVTCESGYHFVGWYYEDHNGNMAKILDPANYVAVGDETIYAMAEQDVPAGHDYTGFFIGLIVIMVLILLAACVGIYLKATDKPAKKTTKR